ncbi:MAG: biopolymer transporter ExbD [Hyphomonadaceae bacterium]
MAALIKGRKLSLRPAADPNMIPFIDVLLVLLIIFMVTAPKPTTDLKLDLPPPTIGLPSPIEPTTIALRATPSGNIIFVGSEAVAFDQLGARTLAHILGADPRLTPQMAYAEARVFVRADLDVAYADVVAVVEELQDSQFRTVSIVAQDADA